MTFRPMLWLLSLLVLLPIGIGAHAQPDLRVVLNEILYDPPGPDDGREYIEILNASEVAVTLTADWQLERGNGARAGDWAAFWSGDGTVLDAGMRLVIGDDPRADRTTTPALQNGPDACRIRAGARVIDLVGWGEHVFPEYHEGPPAPDPAYGLLVRRPDGVDQNRNAIDLVPGERETPGERNFDRYRIGIAAEFPALAPPLPESGDGFEIRVKIRSQGLHALEPGRAGLRSVGDGRSWSLEDPLPPGGSRTLRLPFPGRPVGDYVAEIESWGDSVGLVTAEVPFRVGTGPVIINEIMARPAEDEPEWVELATRIGEAVDLAGWTLADASGSTAALAEILVPGSARVVTADPAPLLGAYPTLEAGAVLAVSGLPSLNDTGETLYLISLDGRLADAVTFEAPVAGRSLERVHAEIPSSDPAAWAVSPRGHTPGRENGAHADPPSEPALTVKPPVVGTEGTEIGFHLGDDIGDLRLTVIDPAGEVRGVLLSRDETAPRGGLQWDGRLDGRVLPPGLYVLEASVVLSSGRRVVRRVPFAVGWTATGEED